MTRCISGAVLPRFVGLFLLAYIFMCCFAISVVLAQQKLTIHFMIQEAVPIINSFDFLRVVIFLLSMIDENRCRVSKG